MTKLHTGAAELVLALNRDVTGNWLSGNDERAMRYLAIQNELLVKLVEAMQTRGSKAEKELEALGRAIANDKHPAYSGFPAFQMNDAVFVERKTSMKFLDGSLTSVTPPPEALFETGLAIAKASGASSFSVKLTSEQAAAMLKPS
jgi:hypothetical protein